MEHRVFTLAYRLVENPRPGRFDLAAAQARGVPPGPLYKRLQDGQDVVLSDGRAVRSAEILGPPRPGRKFVYMVDTRPSAEGVEFARGADVLVHDGMFDDEFAEEAVRRGHSTTREAALSARDAGARRLILTHVSPRYQNIETLLPQAREVFPGARIARDLDVYEIPYPDEVPDA